MSVDTNNFSDEYPDFAFVDSFKSGEDFELQEEHYESEEEIQEDNTFTFFEEEYLQKFFKEVDKISDSFFGKGKGKSAKNIMPHFHSAYVYEYYE